MRLSLLNEVPTWVILVVVLAALANTLVIIHLVNKLVQRTRLFDLRSIYIDKRLEAITLLLSDLYPVVGENVEDRQRIGQERKLRALSILKEVDKHAERARAAIRELNPDLHPGE